MENVSLETVYSGLPWSGKNIWKMIFFPGQGKVREFCGWPGKGLGSIRGVFGPMSKISFTLSNYHFVIWDKNYRRYFVI